MGTNALSKWAFVVIVVAAVGISSAVMFADSDASIETKKETTSTPSLPPVQVASVIAATIAAETDPETPDIAEERIVLEKKIEKKPEPILVQTRLTSVSRITIPKIGVNAPIDLMGLTADGAMEAPVGGANAGWYKYGPLPGEVGNAVISGHYGPWKNGDGSVFDDLNKLQPGDEIHVEDTAGAIITFKVRAIEMYELDADATNVFTSTDGKAHLNIVTCQGKWNSFTKTFSHRLIVFADKV